MARRFLLLAFTWGWLTWLTGCTPTTSSPKGNFGQSPQLQLEHPLRAPSSQALLTQFAAAHARADSVVKLAIPDAKDWACLTTNYGFSYPNWEAHSTDTLPGPARVYKFYYGLLHQGDTVRSAIVSIGADLRIHPSDLAELVAYQQFLRGELPIGQRKAVSIGTHYGLQEAGASVTFHSGNVALIDTLSSLRLVRAYYAALIVHPVLFYWELSNECNGCAWLRISARSGDLLLQGKTQVIY
jgi:hypothetical protein